MSFVSGTGIGPYLIEREIGRGGMGVVYLARDPRLDRNVAIKALPEHLAAEPARLERFEIEARSLAQLNHPNVAGILGLEEKEGQKFLILEYVEGESLAERLQRGSMSVEEALAICVQIAAGVEAAHEAGVIHRDLKPDNIRITPGDEVKVLDFGLAKMDAGSSQAISGEDLHDAPTLTSPQRHSPTMTGMVMGTAAYMSPEQARGQRIDKRTDIWSFGVILYECLCGDGPFIGETAVDSIGAILHKEAEFERLPASTPPMVRHVLGGCLERDRTLRYRDIGDVRLELVRAVSGPGDVTDEPRPGPARSMVIGLVLAASIVVAAATWFGKPSTPPSPLPVVNAEFSLPDSTRMAHAAYPGLDISPDGKSIAFFYGDDSPEARKRGSIRAQGVMVRHLDQPEALSIGGPGERMSQIAFSPDGRWVACHWSGSIYKVPVTGGQPIKMASIRGTCGLTWGDDGTIVAGNNYRGLMRFPSAGGAIDTLTFRDREADELSHRLPHFIPGSDVVLFTVKRHGHQMIMPGAWSIWALRLSTGERKQVVEDASDARFANGHVVFVRAGSLFAVPFDPDGLVVTGAPRQVLEGVQHSRYAIRGNAETGAGMYAISATGTLVYAAGSVFPERAGTIVTVDRAGNETTLDIEPRQYLCVRGSPDGGQILLSTYYAPTSSVWIHDLERGISRRQKAGGTGHLAVWGPGPGRITYDRTMDDGTMRLVHKPVNRSDDEEVEIELPEYPELWVSGWSRDGKYLLGVNMTKPDLWIYSNGDGWSPLVETDNEYEAWPAFSPDGRWLAYVSGESGGQEVLVRPFPGPGATVQVSRHGGSSPVWSRDGSELFYRSLGNGGDNWIMAVPVDGVGDSAEFGLPRQLFKDRYGRTNPVGKWDVLESGDFVFSRHPTEEQARERYLGIYANRIRVVQNWASTLD